MDLKDLLKFQLEFSKKHFNKDHTKPKDFDAFLNKLQFGTIALCGEVGEFANVVKKILRERDANKKTPEERLISLNEELVDVFAYTLILSATLGIDLEKEYLKKMEKNKERFPAKN
jgi:NTP pyrophosphatase (non-canonical NTP hydrolase)